MNETTIPDLLHAAARSAIADHRLEAAAEITAHYLTVASPEHPAFADVQAMAGKLADGSIAREIEQHKEQATALAEALAERQRRKRLRIQRRTGRQRNARAVVELLNEGAMTQTQMRQRLGIDNGYQWSKTLRMAMALLGYAVRLEPNSVVVAAMRDYQARQRRTKFNTEDTPA